MHRTLTSQLSLVLIAPTHGGMARLGWPGWLVRPWSGSVSWCLAESLWNGDQRGPSALGQYSRTIDIDASHYLHITVRCLQLWPAMGLDRKLQYHSPTGCCICGTKTSSSRFTNAGRFETLFKPCFGISFDDDDGDRRSSSDMCNACVLIVKRFRNTPPRNSTKNWAHVSWYS